MATLLRQEGYNIEASVPVAQPVQVSLPIHLPMKLSKKARRRLKKNKALHQQQQQQQQQQEATIQKAQFQQAYQTCVPFVTYSKVDNMMAPT